MELVSSSKRRFFIKAYKNVESILITEGVYGNNRKCCNFEKSISRTFYNEEELHLVDQNNSPSFSKLVKKFMANKGLTSKDIYKNSLIDRKLFSALNVNDNYSPSKETAIMYCFALKLNENEALNLLGSAGYTLYKYSNFDLIVTYFLKNGIYNIDRLNDTLYYYTKKCIGYR